MASDQQDNAPESTAVTDAIEALIGGDSGQAAAEPVAVDPPVSDSPAEPVAEPPAEEPEESTESTEPAEPASDLIEEAVSTYGLTKERAEKLGDSLADVLALMDRQAAQLMRDELADRQPPVEDEPAPKAEGAAAERKAPPAAIGALSKFEFPEGFDRDFLDEGTLKVHDATAEKLNEVVEALNQRDEVLKLMARALAETHGTVSQAVEKTQSEVESAFANDMDETFAGLSEDFHDTYGTAPMSQLASNPKFVENRQKLVEEMRILEMTDQRAGRQKSSTKQLAQRALRALHADKEHAAVRREVDTKLKAKRAAGIARPTGRSNAQKDDPASRKLRALAAIEKNMSKLGI